MSEPYYTSYYFSIALVGKVFTNLLIIHTLHFSAQITLWANGLAQRPNTFTVIISCFNASNEGNVLCGS